MIADKEIYHQIARVLRRREGDAVNLLDNSGFEYRCVIEIIGKNDLVLKIESGELNLVEPKTQITLYQSLLKKDKIEWVFEKCTEIGISRFAPVRSEHSIRLNINTVRARKVLKEAAEQCGRGKIPDLDDIAPYREAIAQAKTSGALNMLLHNQNTPEVTGNFDFPGAKNINLFVGPEGGFSAGEIDLAVENNFKIISISPRTLRAETAAIAGSFLCFMRRQ